MSKDKKMSDEEFKLKTSLLVRDLKEVIDKHLDVNLIVTGTRAEQGDTYELAVQSLLTILSRLTIATGITLSKQLKAPTEKAVYTVAETVMETFGKVIEHQCRILVEQVVDSKTPSNC